MADPFAFLVANILHPVRLDIVNGDVITGVLLSLDDSNNVLLSHWTCDHVQNHQAEDNGPALKRGRSEVAVPSEGIRFIRGSQIKSMGLKVPAAAV